ncbi:MAG: hypothetical protein FWH23_06140 [Bacteroidales bacterium]|nr:hypothetical protein [Bacteroidales bacterium]MCL2133868.1 hypothetical protein [Bacteroidales bacterium]
MKTMKTIKLMLAAVLGLVLLNNCSDGDDAVTKSSERNIISISFAGQIGPAEINRTAGSAEVTFVYNTEAGSLASIQLQSLEISAKAKASVSVGDMLNFSNPTNTVVITVTAEDEQTLNWEIKLIPFTEELVGTWKIKNMWLYGGWPYYDMSAVFFLNQKTARWDQTTGPIAEDDNILVFAMTGVDENGNTYGTVTNQAGDDGLWADFIYKPSSSDGNLYDNYAATGIDLNDIYRVIPKGAASWTRNYGEGTITFKFPGGEERVCQLGDAADFNNYEFEEESGGIKKPGGSGGEYPELVASLLANKSFFFDVSDKKIIKLPGTDDDLTVGAYADGEKYVKNITYVWVEVEKQ